MASHIDRKDKDTYRTDRYVGMKEADGQCSLHRRYEELILFSTFNIFFY